MNNFSFYPYEELRATLTSGEELLLETPWTQIALEVPAEEKELFQKMCENLAEKSLFHENISEFLSAFSQNFIAYTTPRSIPLQIEQCTRSQQKIQKLESENVSAWVDAFVPAVAHRLKMNYDWQWSLNEVLNHSRIANTEVYDPESAYRSIMRLVLKAMSSEQKPTRLIVEHFRNLAKKNEAMLFEAAKLFIRQYHHITSTSSDCLMPAMYNMPYAKDLVQELMEEEHGHGAFTTKSFKELSSENIYDIPVDPYTVGLMDLLRQSAHTSPLAFAVLFTIFEVTGEQDDDPLATILSQSSKPKASAGLQSHFQLNKDGAHFQSGFPLIEKLQGVNRESVIEAARFAELLVLFFDSTALDIIKRTSI